SLVVYACGVWHDQRSTLKPAYHVIIEESYKDETRAYEEAREEINSWVSKATNELITSILPKDSWSKPFATEDTKDRPFYRHDGTHVSAPLMKSRKDQFVTVLDGFKVLKLPYVNSRDDDRRNWRKSVATNQNSDDDDDDDECSRPSFCFLHGGGGVWCSSLYGARP
ncbi:hypothetical protein EJB05_30568, partial [Eragrostis curvula]